MASRSPGDECRPQRRIPKLLRRAVQGFEAAVETLVCMCGGLMTDKGEGFFFSRGLKTCLSFSSAVKRSLQSYSYIILSIPDSTKLRSVDDVS